MAIFVVPKYTPAYTFSKNYGGVRGVWKYRSYLFCDQV